MFGYFQIHTNIQFVDKSAFLVSVRLNFRSLKLPKTYISLVEKVTRLFEIREKDLTSRLIPLNVPWHVRISTYPFFAKERGSSKEEPEKGTEGKESQDQDFNLERSYCGSRTSGALETCII